MKHSIHIALVLAAALVWGGWDWLRRPDKDVDRGNAAFVAKDYQGALDAYGAALQTHGPAPRIHYDMGAALYKLAENTQGPAARVDLYDQAARAFRQATSTPDPTLRSLAQYNLGNTLARLGYYEEAVLAYKQALRANPLNDDARHNLELIQRRLRPAHDQMTPQGRGPSGQDSSGQDSSGQDSSGQDSSGHDSSGQDSSGQGQQSGDSSEDTDPESDASGSSEPGGQQDSPGQSGQRQGSSSTGQSEPGQAGISPAQPDQGSGSNSADARKTPGKQGPSGPMGKNPGQPDAAGADKENSREHASGGDVNKKLDALERMSRELRRSKLRNSATQSRRRTSGKDW